MKKLIVIALVFMAGATLTTQAKDKKKKPMSTSQQAAVKLVSASDSLSYLAGMTATDGLVPYLQQSFQVDTTNMADFLKGFREAQSRVGDPAFKAYAAGMQIAEMVNSRILPNMKKAFEGSNDSIQRAMFLNGFTAHCRMTPHSSHKAKFPDSIASVWTMSLRRGMPPIRRKTKTG